MVFADLKNDYIFRRIFGTHPDILRGLLNDLLERTGDRTIEGIEYLPSEQLPLVQGAKLSILDVRCKDRGGNKFAVEMQLIHVSGFLNRVIYNACKAYADQLAAGKPYASLTDVVAISICDFELWPDAEQDEQQLCRVPMLSRWYVTEQSLDRADLKKDQNKLLQVQYAFLELPKLPAERPESGAALWAWLFVHAPELTDIPDDLPPGPYRAVLDLANQARFTQTELEAYRKAMDEIQQARDYGAAKEAAGLSRGLAEGLAEGMVRALLAVLGARGLPVSTEARARIDACKGSATLDRWIVRAATAVSVEDVLAANPEERA
jgi:PD-(D/E)XK nuclease family transposase